MLPAVTLWMHEGRVWDLPMCFFGSNSISRSLCCPCSLYLQLPMLTVAVLSTQPWSSCRGAAFTGPPTPNRVGGGVPLVLSMLSQHSWAQFNVLSSTLFSGGGGEAQLFNLHVILTDTQSACLLYYPTQPGVLSQKLSSATLENSKSRSTQKNSNPCYSWLFMYCDFSIFSTI